MKTIVKLTLALIIVFVSSCTNNEMTDNLNVDVKKYDNLLATDYANASKYVSPARFQNTIGENYKTSSTGFLENDKMFHHHDSLFSQHFYEFAIDMMKNKGFINGMSGMMNYNGGIMNGYTMGSNEDMNHMIEYMESTHADIKTHQHPNYSNHDSLMYVQMRNRHMMSYHTLGIENTYNKMQQLRKDHQNKH